MLYSTVNVKSFDVANFDAFPHLLQTKKRIVSITFLLLHPDG